MSRIVVTGAAGFIGSNIIKGLNARGITNIMAVDDLTQGDKFLNLARVQINDYVDASTFYDAFTKGTYGKVEAIFHEGACSDTMETNGKYMMANNYTLSCQLFNACKDHRVRLLYASSAATYGNSSTFSEDPIHERPLNVYGYSKLLFDQYLRAQCGNNDFPALNKTRNRPDQSDKVLTRPTGIPQLVGFRYFNVYGPHEQHKNRMASVAFHQFHQFQKEQKVKLFGSYGGYNAGEQMRDFIFIDDVIAVNLWFFDHPQKNGIFNLGSGQAQPFNDVAQAVINTFRAESSLPSLTLHEMQAQHLIEYVDFPDALCGKYQCHTQADLTRLRQAGCQHVFAPVQVGVANYVRWLTQNT